MTVYNKILENRFTRWDTGVKLFDSNEICASEIQQ